ncbi:hypothetical protein U1Q18_040297, partial [Sarracenia purpurea var. burkii]
MESINAHNVFEQKPHPTSDAQSHPVLVQKLVPKYGKVLPLFSEVEGKEILLGPMRKGAPNKSWAKVVASGSGKATDSEAQS